MDSLQRGPLFRSDSDSESPFYQSDEANYRSSIGRWRESFREEAFNTARLSPEIDSVQRYVQMLGGQFWNRNRPKYRSRFFDNRLNNSRQNDLALLTDTRPTISVTSQVEAYKEHASIASAMIQSEWTMRNMDLDLVMVTDITKLNGTGFWKIGACFPGKMQVLPCGPESVLPVQPGFHLQQSTAVLYRTWKSVGWFRHKYPFAAAGLESETAVTEQSGRPSMYSRPSDMPEYTWNALSPQMKRSLGVQGSAVETSTPSMFQNIELQECYLEDHSINESANDVLIRNPFLSLKAHNYWYWVKPGQRLYPRKRLLVFAGRRLMYDGPSPFWHGLFPFACMRLNPVPWSFWGMSKYRDLLPLNEAMNEIGAGVMDLVKRALNPVTLTKANAVPIAAWREFFPDLPGAKLMMSANSNIADITYLPPPQIPPMVLTFHQFLAGEFDRLSGSMDVNSFGKKKQMPGGDTIEAMREMQNSITRLEGRYMEKFLEDAGEQALSNFFQYFTWETNVARLGEQGLSFTNMEINDDTLIPANMPKEKHWQKFAFKVAQGSLLSNAKDREKQIAISLSGMGLLPVLELYKRLEFPDPESLLKELLSEREQGLTGGSKSSRMTRGQRNGQAA